MARRDTIIVDLDGTLADHSHRLRHVLVNNTVRWEQCSSEGRLMPSCDYCDSLFMAEHKSSCAHFRSADWERFCSDEEILKDEPVEAVQNIIERCASRVVLCTARSEKFRRVTEEWLEKHLLRHEFDDLMFRADLDDRTDADVKSEMLDKIGPERVLFVLDDSSPVVEMWRRRGLACLQVRDDTLIRIDLANL